MKKTFISALLAATLLGSSVSFAVAGPMGGGFNGGLCSNAYYGYHARGGFGLQYMQKELNLTPNQVQQIERLRKEVFQNFANNQSNYKMPMYDAIKSGSFNKQVFIEESEQNARLRAQNQANYMEKFFSILTPAQRQKFVELQKQRMQFALQNMENKQRILENRINYLKSNIQ